MIRTPTSHLHGLIHTGSTICIVRSVTTIGGGETIGILPILTMADGVIIHGDTIRGTARTTAAGDIRIMDITDTTITAGDIHITDTVIIGEETITAPFTRTVITL